MYGFQQGEILEMNTPVIVDINNDGTGTFKGFVVGKATTDISQMYIVKCTDGALPNDSYPYDTCVIPLCCLKMDWLKL